MRRPPKKATLAGAFVLLAQLAPAGSLTSADAHPEWSPIRVNRYAKLVLETPGKSKLVYTILYGDGPGLAARRSVDLDGNGRLDERERTVLSVRSAAAVRAGLRLTIDGAALELTPTTVDVGLAGMEVAPQPFSIDLTYPISLAPGRHELLLDDRVEVPSEGDSEIAIEATSPTEIIAAHRGSHGSGVEKTFSFRGPRFSLLEDRSVGITLLRSDSTLWTRTRRLAPLSMAATALALVGLWALRLRREAQRSMKG